MNEHDVLTGMSYAGLGAIVIATIAFFVVQWMKIKLDQMKKEAASEGSFTSVMTDTVAAVRSSYEGVTVELRNALHHANERGDKLQEQLFTTISNFNEATLRGQAQTREDIAKIKEEGDRANIRIHKRMDECEQRDKVCQERLIRLEGFEEMVKVLADKQPTNITLQTGKVTQAAPLDLSQTHGHGQ